MKLHAHVIARGRKVLVILEGRDRGKAARPDPHVLREFSAELLASGFVAR